MSIVSGADVLFTTMVDLLGSYPASGIGLLIAIIKIPVLLGMIMRRNSLGLLFGSCVPKPRPVFRRYRLAGVDNKG